MGRAVLNQLLLPIPPVFVGSLVSCGGAETPLEVVVVEGSEMSGLPLVAVVSNAVEVMLGSLVVVGSLAVVVGVAMVSEVVVVVVGSIKSQHYTLGFN